MGLLVACLAWRPNVIYLNQVGCYKIAAIAARVFGIPMIAHVRIFEDATYLARQYPVANRLRGMVAISQAIADEIRMHESLTSIPLHIIYDGYVPHLEGEESLEGLRAVESIACLGRIVPIKGQDVLLDAFALLHARLPAVKCSFIGSGDEFERQLRSRAEALGIERFIEWLGFMQQPHTVLQMTNVLVVPSHREPLGRVIFEAWDAGCLPVVFAHSGGAAEVISASGGGLIYSEQTPVALASCLVHALTLEADQRAAMMAAGRRWMKEHCSPSRYAQKVEKVFFDAMMRPPVQL